MLPRKHRATREHIEGLRKNPHRKHTDHIYFLYTNSFPDEGTRISCAVSKKVSSRAVDRNRLKRQCREAVRENMEMLSKPTVGLISFKKGAHNISYQTLEKEIRGIFKEVG